jgi:hypothetical protein
VFSNKNRFLSQMASCKHSKCRKRLPM